MQLRFELGRRLGGFRARFQKKWLRIWAEIARFEPFARKDEVLGFGPVIFHSVLRFLLNEALMEDYLSIAFSFRDDWCQNLSYVMFWGLDLLFWAEWSFNGESEAAKSHFFYFYFEETDLDCERNLNVWSTSVDWAWCFSLRRNRDLRFVVLRESRDFCETELCF